MSIFKIQKKDGNIKVQNSKTKQQASRTVQELLDIHGIEE